MSTNLTSSSLMNVRTSSAELNIQPPDVGRGRPDLGSTERQGSRDGLVLSVSTLSTGDFSAMTLMFRGCYGWTGPGKGPDRVSLRWCPWWTARTSAHGSRAPERVRTPTGSTAAATSACRRSGPRLRGRLRHPLRRACSSTGPSPRSSRVASSACRCRSRSLRRRGPGLRGARRLRRHAPAARRHGRLHDRPPDHGPAGALPGRRRRVLPLQALARTVLLCLFLPAVVWDRDGRGLHDKVPNTVIVRTR